MDKKLPSGSDAGDAPSRHVERPAKEANEANTSGSGNVKKAVRARGAGNDGKPVRHSVRPGGLSPLAKPKPAVAPETAVSDPPLSPSGTSGKKRRGHRGTGALPSHCLDSPNLPPSPSATATAKSPPQSSANDTVGCAVCGGAVCGCGQASMLLQRTGSSRHGAFVRVIDYGVTAEQGTRRTMEDQHTMHAEGVPFFGVYDGHGGTQCAEYLRDNLHSFILGHPDIKTNPEKAISDSIVKADHDFLQRSEEDSNESGSVCAVALILDDNLVVGNVGDCEAVLCRNGAPIVLTVKHNLACNPAEVERVKEAGGRVFHNRVGHPKFNPSVVSLAVTRAIGDAGFKLDEYTDGKRSGIIAVPDTKTIKLTPEDEFLIIGCDGLWDVMSYDEVVDFCGRRFKRAEAAQSITDDLARAAIDRGGTDNVTAMLILLTRRRDSASGQMFPETAVSTSVRNLTEEA